MDTMPNAALPNPFLCAGGQQVRTLDDWRRRRRELLDLTMPLEYGGLPPTPPVTHLEELHTATVGLQGGARFMSCRVNTGPERPFSFLLTLLIPPGNGPFPVVLTGDACWRYETEEIIADVLRRKMIMAQFNRV